MELREHLIFGGAATLMIAPFYGAESLAFLVGSVLIDADHYIDYVYYTRFKNWSVKDMFKFHGTLARWAKYKNFHALEAFHTLEFLAGILIVGLYFNSTPVLLLFSGMVFHLILDLIRLYKWGKVNLRALTFVGYWRKSRASLKKGINLETTFREAYAASQMRFEFPKLSKELELSLN